MAQFFGIEDIKLLSKTSQTTIEWEAGSLLRIGGQAYTVNSALILDLATDIDTGSVAADTKYYIYAINSSGVSLVYSLSGSAPVGYNAYRKIGAFKTDIASQVSGVADSETALSALSAAQLTTAAGLAPSFAARAFVTFNGSGTVLSSGNVSSVTNLGGGNYRVNFTTPMQNTNYSYSINNFGISHYAMHDITNVTDKNINYITVAFDQHSAGTDRQDITPSQVSVVIFA